MGGLRRDLWTRFWSLGILKHPKFFGVVVGEDFLITRSGKYIMGIDGEVRPPSSCCRDPG